jgi:hypothetical protein
MHDRFTPKCGHSAAEPRLSPAGKWAFRKSRRGRAIDDRLAQNFVSRETPVRFEPRIGVTSIEPAIDADGRLESVVVSFKDVQDGRADSVLVEYTPWLRK